MYRITKDKENGEPEVALTIEGTEEEAKAAFMKIIDEQCYEYHDAKTMKKWRKIRLWDENGNCIGEES